MLSFRITHLWQFQRFIPLLMLGRDILDNFLFKSLCCTSWMSTKILSEFMKFIQFPANIVHFLGDSFSHSSKMTWQALPWWFSSALWLPWRWQHNNPTPSYRKSSRFSAVEVEGVGCWCWAQQLPLHEWMVMDGVQLSCCDSIFRKKLFCQHIFLSEEGDFL